VTHIIDNQADKQT